MVSRNNWEAVVVEQREPVQIFQLEGDLRRECPGYVFSSSAVLVRQSLIEKLLFYLSSHFFLLL